LHLNADASIASQVSTRLWVVYNHVQYVLKENIKTVWGKNNAKNVLQQRKHVRQAATLALSL
jgi:hypothetical protein